MFATDHLLTGAGSEYYFQLIYKDVSFIGRIGCSNYGLYDILFMGIYSTITKSQP